MPPNHILKFAVADFDRYASLNPYFPQAFAFLRRPDLAQLAPGRYEIDGDNCWANISDAKLSPVSDEMTYEAHAKYIDIQAPLDGPETFGILDTPAGTPPADPKKDYVLFPAKGRTVTLVPGEFAIFFPPNGAHAPQHALDGATQVRKVVVKIRAVSTAK